MGFCVLLDQAQLASSRICAVAVRPVGTLRHYMRTCASHPICPAKSNASLHSGGMRLGLRPYVRGEREVLRVGRLRNQQGSREVKANALTPLQELEANLFAASLFPYLGFIYYLRKARSPTLLRYGFTFLLVFVGGSIPAAILAMTQYDTVLANVDWLHGTAESMLTLTNFFIVFGARKAIQDYKKNAAKVSPESLEHQEPDIGGL